MVAGSGQWVVNLLHYLIMKCPTPLVSVLSGSIIPTFLFNFCNYLKSFGGYFWGYFSKYINGISKVLFPGSFSTNNHIGYTFHSHDEDIGLSSAA